MRPAAITLSILLLTGCSSAIPEPPEQTAEQIPWDDYPPSLKQIIDEEIAAKHCAELQGMFDIQDSSNASMIEASGHGNEQVMSYIDDGLRTAGCY